MSDNVYIQSNEPQGNRVLAFRRDPDGTLVQRGTFATGGAGSGAPHLQSQGCVVLTREGRHLLVTNAGSGDLSVFETGEEALTLLHTIPSGGAPRTLPSTAGGSTEPPRPSLVAPSACRRWSGVESDVILFTGLENA